MIRTICSATLLALACACSDPAAETGDSSQSSITSGAATTPATGSAASPPAAPQPSTELTPPPTQPPLTGQGGSVTVPPPSQPAATQEPPPRPPATGEPTVAVMPTSATEPSAPASGGAATTPPASPPAGDIPAGLPPIEGKLVSPPASPPDVPAGSFEICKSGDGWVSLVSGNGIGCIKACQSQGMNCRRSYQESGCAPQPWEIGCGDTGHAGDFCACSADTFWQGVGYDLHPKQRDAIAPEIETCQAGKGWAAITFHRKQGCTAACESLGLKCHSATHDLEYECGPQADPDFKANCTDTERTSDFCVCTVDGTAAGVPESITSPWRPF